MSQIFKNHIVTVAFKWCVPSASDVFQSKNDNSGGKTREASEVMEYDFYFTEYDFCPVITCSDFYPLSNQINLFMVINIWGILIKILFSSPCQRQCELLPSLGVRRLSSINFSHFNLLLWNPPSQMKWNLVGSIYGRSSLKIAHFVPIR